MAIGGAPLFIVTEVAVVVVVAPAELGGASGTCFLMHRQQQQMVHTIHTTRSTTVPTVIEIAAVTPSDRNLLNKFSSGK